MQALNVIVVAVAALGPGLMAQVREGHAYYEAAGGLFAAQADAQVLLEWQWTVNGVAGSGSVAMPSDIPGAIEPWGQSLLVSGVSSTTGVGYLTEVTFSLVNGVVVASSQSAPIGTRDLIHLWVGGNDMLALDYNSSEVICGDLSGGVAGVVPVVVGNQTSLPIMTAQNMLFMLSLHDARDSLGGCVLGFDPSLGAGVLATRYRIKKAGGQWSVTAMADLASSVPSVWAVDVLPDVAANHTDYVVRIANGSGAFSIRDLETGLVVFSGTHTASPPGTEQGFQVPAAALTYGHRYSVESAGGQATLPSTYFRMFQEWMRGVTVPGVETDRISVRWDYPSVGMDSVGWVTHDSNHPVGPMLVGCYVGAWDYSVDPMVPSGLGFDVLAFQYGVLGPFFASPDGSGVTSVGFAMNVNNPVFTGTRAAFHFVGVLPSIQFVTSDVHGVVLH